MAMDVAVEAQRLGWLGTGRMGYAMAARLLAAGQDVAVWNRTRSKAEPLSAEGASVVDMPGDLADRPIVFTMVSAGDDLEQVLFGDGGLLTGKRVPGIVVDSSTVDIDHARVLRERAAKAGATVLAAPVSGNAKAVRAGALTMCVSGDRVAFERVQELVESIARSVTYVGADEAARLVKICHNLFLGAVSQSMAEITVLAEKGGVSRHDFLAFLNDSVLGSVFTRYKSPAFINLDLAPTFTPVLLRKDFDLGLAAGRRLDVPMPVAALVHQIVSGAVAEGHVDEDFAVLLQLQARSAGMTLVSEERDVSHGFATSDPETDDGQG